jgi:glutathione synthase/RimK-type ligase-like ATP-grasp enzyme
MKILLSEGSGLTSRQVAGILWAKGHEVGVVSSDPIGLTRFTRSVKHWHSISAFSTDTVKWLDTAIDVYRTEGYDLLFPTQEQVAVLAARPRQLADARVVTAVPTFESLLAVQDKLAATATLNRLGLAQPDSHVVTSRNELSAWDRFPVYVKTPIGTATSGVNRLDQPGDLRRLLDTPAWDEAFDDGGVVVQTPAAGPLAMVQTVFDQGRLLAFHANLRIREGARGGASHKRSIDAPQVRQILQDLGAALRWHGALSVDVIFTETGPVIIDVNPRLVEPINAQRSGVDLVDAMLAAAQHRQAAAQPDGTADVNTHQLLLAVLGAAQKVHGRRRVLKELIDAAARRNDYQNSTEELTPFQPRLRRRDWRAPIPVVVAAAATLIAPTNWHRFATNSVESYALTPTAWRTIKQHTQPSPP